ncbi:GNAT family N-acetyltransferase [Jannaschia sp. S6380]|uniref:GNAT family N-acetyltransferase n=1 Tax=Jannaschia sp. S6380 TaxID=2926408 RepID=UPI001FF1F2EB|nr:GNAT family N-acetyltransferase [Jannaschia sp. S6380]MCK0168054.1 GNAT family N-acetyltransferase [Jannaschia sp. S6380]
MSAVAPPTLRTARLTLRAPTVADSHTFAAFLATDRAAHLGGPVPDPTAGHRAFGHAMGLWTLRGYGPLVMDLDGTGIGMAGPWFPVMFDEPELAWTIWDPAREGHGLAFEAASATRDWARDALRLPSLVSYIAPGNDRSIRLAERLGATLEPDDDFDPEEDDLVYRHWGPA